MWRWHLIWSLAASSEFKSFGEVEVLAYVSRVVQQFLPVAVCGLHSEWSPPSFLLINRIKSTAPSGWCLATKKNSEWVPLVAGLKLWRGRSQLKFKCVPHLGLSPQRIQMSRNRWMSRASSVAFEMLAPRRYLSKHSSHAAGRVTFYRNRPNWISSFFAFSQADTFTGTTHMP